MLHTFLADEEADFPGAPINRPIRVGRRESTDPSVTIYPLTPLPMATLVIPSDRKERRALLVKLSSKARSHVQSGRFKSVNQALSSMYLAQSGATRLLSSSAWKKKGYRIRKDAVGYPIWARPRKAKRVVEDDQGKHEEDYNFFALAHLFTEQQVEQKKPTART